MRLDTDADANPAQLIDEILATSPDRLAVKDSGGSVTYGELSTGADTVARRLIALGVSVPLILLAWPTNADQFCRSSGWIVTELIPAVISHDPVVETFVRDYVNDGDRHGPL